MYTKIKDTVVKLPIVEQLKSFGVLRKMKLEEIIFKDKIESSTNFIEVSKCVLSKIITSPKLKREGIYILLQILLTKIKESLIDELCISLVPNC